MNRRTPASQPDFGARPLAGAAIRWATFAVEARIVLDERWWVLIAPTGALFRNGDEWAVFTVDAA